MILSALTMKGRKLMTSKERMLCAINREKPDRMPVTIHQWQPYHLLNYMDGMTDLEAFKDCGLDASINYFATLPASPTPDWKESTTVTRQDGYTLTRYSYETPEGTLTCVKGSNAMTTWVTEHLIKNYEDIQLLKKYRPVPRLDRDGAVAAYDKLGQDGILRSFVIGEQGGCWQDACELYGMENLIYATFDEPEWVHEFLEILLEQKQRYIYESLPNLPFDLIETGGGASSNNVISPTIHEEFCLPYDRKMHDMLHELGYKTTYHTCGGMTKIVDLIVRNHTDVSETLSPVGVGGDIKTPADAAVVYNILHPKVGMIGGVDQFHILEEGTREEIYQEVDRLYHEFGEDGGYIMSASDHFFKAPPENLKILAEAAHQIRY